MDTTLRVAALAIVSVLGAIPGLGSLVVQNRPVESTPPLSLVGATREQEARVHQAVARYRAEQLELPPLEIEFFDTTDPCQGNAGQYFRADSASGGVDTILICHRLPVILLHELAHATSCRPADPGAVPGPLGPRLLERPRTGLDQPGS